MADTPPPLPEDSSPQMTDMASDLRDLSSEVKISKELEALLARGIHGAKLPQVMKSKRAAEAFQQAFDIIGGIPRLAIWADANPDKFFALYARMIPQTIGPVLPETEDKGGMVTMPWITARRLMYQEGAVLAEDIQARPVVRGKLVPPGELEK